MAASLTATNIFGSLAAGNQNLSLFDANYAQLYGALNTLTTFSNFYSDAGVANAYAITIPSPQVFSLAAGVPLEVQILNSNTGASTLQVTYGTVVSGAITITNPDASALTNGQLPAGTVARFVYSTATSTFILVGGGIPTTASAAVALITSGTFTTATSFSATGFSTSYSMYRLKIFGVTTSTTSSILMRYNADAGTNYATANYFMNTEGTLATSTAGTGTNQFTIGGAVDGASSFDFTCEVRMFNVTSTALNKNILNDAWYYIGTSRLRFSGGGDWSSLAAVTSVMILPTAGTFTGKYVLLGET